MPYEFLNNMFPSKIPPATHEYPALTFCPPDPKTTIAVASCYRLATATKESCAKEGIYQRKVSFESEELQCWTVNDIPGQLLKAETADDVLQVILTVKGTADGSPEGVLVAAHPQRGQSTAFNEWGFENFFAASAYTATEIAGRKLYSIDLKNNVKEEYEIKASSMRMRMDPLSFPGESGTQQPGPAPVAIEFRYPKLEVTYEKAFLVLDMVCTRYALTFVFSRHLTIYDHTEQLAR